MKVTAEPIIHRDEYSSVVEREINAYFDEVIFAPLRAMLRTSGIRENDIGSWGWFPRSWGSLGIPRSQMPQVKGEQRDALVQHFASQGVQVREINLPVESFQPTQDTYSTEKVAKARDYVGQERRILVSSDRHIVDGHHQWVAKKLDNPEGRMPAWKIDLPIRDLLEMTKQFLGQRQNAVNVSALWNALTSGAVWYAADTFTGSFTADISRELRAIGARKVAAGFMLPSRELPMELRGVVAQSQAKSKALHLAILAFLLTAETNIPASYSGMNLRPLVVTITEDLRRQLVRTISATDAPVTIPVNPAYLIHETTEKLQQATEREIKKFGVEEVQRLREKVQQNLSEGGRTDRLEQLVESQLGVTQRKASIIAQAETAQLVSDYRKNRYTALGSKEYVWDTSHDEKVRPTHGESNNHRILDGRKFAWSSPPVVDAATGRRRHPGEDFGPCRCVARPVFTFA